MGKRHYLRFGHKLGHPPGTLIYTGRYNTPFSIVHVKYNPEDFRSAEYNSSDQLWPELDNDHMHLVIIHSLNFPEKIEEIGIKTGLNHLQMEDILSVRNLPKMQKTTSGTLITLRRPMLSAEDGFRTEQITLYMRGETLFVFRELDDDFFSHLMKRFNLSSSRLRQRPAVYLLYAIFDLIVDHYFDLLDQLNEEVQRAEEVLVKNTSPEVIQSVTEIKRNLNLTHRFVYPTHLVVKEIIEQKSNLVEGDMNDYYHDLEDHLQQTLSQLEFLKESAKDLVELHATLLSTKTNQVMTTLTILSSIFIPLTFIAGVYGMNFRVMPELTWANGYYYSLAFMGALGLIMFVWMKTRKWF